METKRILKALEYTPFGFIPGVLRLGHVAGRSVCSLFSQKERIEKIDHIASKYLTQEKPGTKLVQETIRGIVDCIPVINTICLGIHDLFFVKKQVSQSLPVDKSKDFTLDDEAIACYDAIKRNCTLPLNVFFLEKHNEYFFISYVEEKSPTIRLTRRQFQFDPNKKNVRCRIGKGPFYTTSAENEKEALQKVVEHLASTTEQKGSYVNIQEYMNSKRRVDDRIKCYELISFSMNSEDPAIFTEDIDGD